MQNRGNIKLQMLLVFALVVLAVIVAYVFITSANSRPAAGSPTSVSPSRAPLVTPSAAPTIAAAAATVVPTIRSTAPPTSLPTTATPPRTQTPVSQATTISTASWLTYTNSAIGYRIRYPDTWFLKEFDPTNVFITTFQLGPAGGGGVPPGAVKIDLLVVAKGSTVQPPPPDQFTQKPFCLGQQCGSRYDAKASASAPGGGLAAIVAILVPQPDGRTLSLTVYVGDPKAEADQKMPAVEALIATWQPTK